MSGSKREMIIKALKRKMEQLRSRVEDIENKLQLEEMQPGKKRKKEVNSWLKVVWETELEVNNIVGKNEKTWFSLSTMSLEKPKNILEKVEGLLEQGQFSQGLVLEDFVSKGFHFIVSSLKDQVSKHMLDTIWSCLTGENQLRVGICGMGGVGKSTLALHINNQILKSISPFNHVFWVTVSKETSTYKLQSDIAKEIKLDISDIRDERKRAQFLYLAFFKMKNYVIILDDVWKPISMIEVGVPIEAGLGTLLITSRLISTCQKMQCKVIKVHPLPDNEAWKLFVDELGNYDALSLEVKMIAKFVAKECDGLPLGIIVMARCMRGKFDVYEWKSTLYDLQHSTPFDDEVEDRVFRVLNFSYARLENEKLQKCFQCCALYPEDFPINKNELVHCFISQGLLDNTRRWNEQVDEGYTIINRLEQACLLEKARDGTLKMHDLVRDMIINIMRKMGVVIKSGLSLQQIPAKDGWTSDITKMSLMNNKIASVEPIAWPLECPNLTTLLLQCNPLQIIPEAFFVHMMGLKLLDLSHTEIVSLPNSLSELKNLNALFLKWCRKLKYIPSLIKLKELRMLDLYMSDKVEKLPEGMENFVSLKSLVLNDIWTDVLQRLYNFERLERFRGIVYGFNGFNQYASSKIFDQLDNYQICVHENNKHRNLDVVDDEYCKSLSLCLCSTSASESHLRLPHNVERLLISQCKHYFIKDDEYRCVFYLDITLPPYGSFKALQMLIVSGCASINKLFPLGPLQYHLPNLRIVEVMNCKSMTELFPIGVDIYVPSKEECDNIATPKHAITLPKLERFTLVDVPSLTDICRETIICNSLRSVEINACKNLKRIPFSIREGVSIRDLRPIFETEVSRWNSFDWDDLSTKDKFNPTLF